MSKLEIAMGGKFVRERVKNPRVFHNQSFRMKAVGFHRVITACIKSKWDVKKQKCKVGLKTQAILHPLEEFERLCKRGDCIVKKR